MLLSLLLLLLLVVKGCSKINDDPPTRIKVRLDREGSRA